MNNTSNFDAIQAIIDKVGTIGYKPSTVWLSLKKHRLQTISSRRKKLMVCCEANNLRKPNATTYEGLAYLKSKDGTIIFTGNGEPFDFGIN